MTNWFMLKIGRRNTKATSPSLNLPTPSRPIEAGRPDGRTLRLAPNFEQEPDKMVRIYIVNTAITYPAAGGWVAPGKGFEPLHACA